MKSAIENIDLLIRQGEHGKALSLLRVTVENKVTKSDAVILASFSRRLGKPLIGIRLLYPTVRSEKRIPITALPGEKAEYAACLIRWGAHHEGVQLLRSMTAEELPEVNFFLALGCIAQWDYVSAIKPLSQFISDARISSYQRLIAKVNLIACCVFLKLHEKARPLLTACLADADGPNFRLLKINLLELSAQDALSRGCWDEAEDALTQAENLIVSAQSLDAFFVKKWRAVLVCEREMASARSISLLKKVRSEAENREHWESVRDCDFHLARLTQNEELLRRLYFGTPYGAYKERILKIVPRGIRFTQYVHHFDSLSPQAVIERESGSMNASVDLMKENQVLHRVFLVLTSDLYRPRRVAEIFASLFPKEYFSPLHSPARVHQACHRLKALFASHTLGLQIYEKNGFFRISKAKGLSTSLCYGAVTRVPCAWKTYRDAFKTREFTRQEFAAQFELAQRTASRLLEKGVQEKWLESLGKGRETRYRFAPPS